MKKWVIALAVASLGVGCGGGEQSAAPAGETESAGAVDTVAPPEAAGGDTSTQPAPRAAAAPSAAPAAANPAPRAPAPAAPPAPTFREVTLPAGTTLRLRLQSTVASDTSEVEDVVRAELGEAVAVGGSEVLRPGTAFAGTVTDAAQSGRVKGRARVAYRFESFNYDGERYDITAAPLVHEAEATTRQDATKVAIGAGAGAAIGALLGGGGGAAKGAAIGAAGGTGAVLATRGDEVRVDPGTIVMTTLSAPVTVRVRN